MSNLTETLKKEQNAKNSDLEMQMYEKEMQELKVEIELEEFFISHILSDIKNTCIKLKTLVFENKELFKSDEEKSRFYLERLHRIHRLMFNSLDKIRNINKEVFHEDKQK